MSTPLSWRGPYRLCTRGCLCRPSGCPSLSGRPEPHDRRCRAAGHCLPVGEAGLAAVDALHVCERQGHRCRPGCRRRPCRPSAPPRRGRRRSSRSACSMCRCTWAATRSARSRRSPARPWAPTPRCGAPPCPPSSRSGTLLVAFVGHACGAELRCGHDLLVRCCPAREQIVEGRREKVVHDHVGGEGPDGRDFHAARTGWRASQGQSAATAGDQHGPGQEAPPREESFLHLSP